MMLGEQRAKGESKDKIFLMSKIGNHSRKPGKKRDTWRTEEIFYKQKEGKRQ